MKGQKGFLEFIPRFLLQLLPIFIDRLVKNDLSWKQSADWNKSFNLLYYFSLECE